MDIFFAKWLRHSRVRWVLDYDQKMELRTAVQVLKINVYWNQERIAKENKYLSQVFLSVAEWRDATILWKWSRAPRKESTFKLLLLWEPHWHVLQEYSRENRRRRPQLAHGPQPLLSWLRSSTKMWREASSVTPRLLKRGRRRTWCRPAWSWGRASAARRRRPGRHRASTPGDKPVDAGEVEADGVEHVQQVLGVHCQNVSWGEHVPGNKHHL